MSENKGTSSEEKFMDMVKSGEVRARNVLKRLLVNEATCEIIHKHRKEIIALAREKMKKFNIEVDEQEAQKLEDFAAGDLTAKVQRTAEVKEVQKP